MSAASLQVTVSSAQSRPPDGSPQSQPADGSPPPTPSIDSIRWYRSAAVAAARHGAVDTALFYYQHERTALLASSGRDSNYATNCLRIGVLYAGGKQHYDTALSYLTECRDLREKIFSAHSTAYAEIIGTIANVRLSLNDLEPAAALYRQAQEILQSNGDTTNNTYAFVCNGLLNVAQWRGQYEYAEQLSLTTLRLRGRTLGVHHPSYAISLTQLANLYENIGQYQKAEPLYKEARQIRRDTFGTANPLYIASCISLGQLYYLMGRLSSADSLYLETQRLLEDNHRKGTADYASVRNNQANVDLALGRYADAKTAEEQAGAIWGNMSDNDPNKAIHAGTLAAACLGLGEYRQALELFTQADTLWAAQLGPQHPYYINNLRNLAQVNWAIGNPAKADSLYATALRSRIAGARRIFQFTSEHEQAAYLRSDAGTEDEYYSLLWQTGSAGAAFDIALAERNRILSASRHIREVVSRSGNPQLQQLYHDYITQQQILAGLYSSPNHVTTDDIQTVADSAGQLEKQLSRATESLQSLLHEPPADWKAIQAKLAPGEAAMEWVEFRYFNGKEYADSSFYMALVLRKDRPWPIAVRVCQQRSLDTLLTRAGQHAESLYARGGTLESSNGAGYSRQLYQTVWAPLEAALIGIHTICLAPAGSLYRISFAALPLGKDSVLSDRYRIEQLSSTGDLLLPPMSGLKPGDHVRLYGGVDYGSVGSSGSAPSWPFLPGTVTETDNIRHDGLAKGMKMQLLSGAKATAESVKSLNGSTYPAVLHLATHGFYIPAATDSSEPSQPAPDPLTRSGLVLAGGKILNAFEVSNLYLPAVRLVVLSACETGLGDVQGSEGVYGLARAFRMAGVQNLVMSLWKVPDSATAEFMGLFYRGLFAGRPAQSAFWEAQRIMKKHYRRQPALWAAWIFVR